MGELAELGLDPGAGGGERRTSVIRLPESIGAHSGEFAPAEDPVITFTGLTGAEDAERQLLSALVPERGATTPPVPSRGGIRYPGPGGNRNNLPRRAGGFMGRDDFLEYLWAKLEKGQPRVESVPEMLVLYGLGGIGKTQIALEYAHRYGSQYDLVWWIDADRPGRVQSALAALGDALGLRGDSVREVARATLAALQSDAHGRWLLILDNVEPDEEEEVFREYLPTHGPGHVLITSRHAVRNDAFESIEVVAFTRRESMELLADRLPPVADREMNDLAEELGDLPMAVEHAAAWLRSTNVPVHAYLELLRSEAEPAPGGSAERNEEDPRSHTATWRVSFQQLREERPAAARLLELCSFLSPDHIAASIVYSDPMRRHLGEYEPAARGISGMGSVVLELRRYAFAGIDPSNRSLEVHRLVQRSVRQWLLSDTPAAFESTRSKIQEILGDVRPTATLVFDEGAEQVSRMYRDLSPHLEPSGALESDLPTVREWVIDHVRYLWRSGDPHQALEIGRRVLPLWEQRHGPDDPLLLRLRAQLANPLRSLGMYREAYAHDHEALRRQVKHPEVGSNHPHTLVTRRNYGADLRGLGRYTEAHASDTECHALFKHIMGEDHDDTLRAANNLGVSLNLIGHTGAALELDGRTFEKRLELLGADHPLTLQVAIRIAQGRRETGDFRGAQSLLLETLGRMERVHGTGHPDVLRARRELAVNHRRLGNVRKAEEENREAHEGFLRAHTARHPDTMAAAMSLASSLAVLGEEDPERLTAARNLAEEVYPDYLAVLGEDHPLTLSCASNLAVIRARCGEPAAGLPLVSRAVDRIDETLGSHHPLTLSCRTHVTVVLASAGRTEEALAESSAALLGLGSVYRRRLHLRTLCCSYTTALLRRTVDPSEENEAALEEVRKTFVTEFGSAHFLHRMMTSGKPAEIDIEASPI
ncbi:FxSxx-COOH system tetratricopeptide repeat protein [Streptomyces calidiresistens]|uniref:FxSxx-COOH system tetratricopeptide repeat protein n=1 Tax=Streptomyces calidiresistens TaxID=1485586 RepID=UPI0015F94BFC|nr:FxSxx-COOH system tetratricopeptide repeat protein [Streptomyces calidiresistens]